METRTNTPSVCKENYEFSNFRACVLHFFLRFQTLGLVQLFSDLALHAAWATVKRVQIVALHATWATNTKVQTAEATKIPTRKLTVRQI